MAKLSDNSISFGQGQNTSVRPYVLPDGYYAKGINLTTKNDKLSLRDKWIHTPITVDSDGELDSTTYQKNLDQGKFQGECSYEYEGSDYWIVVISGIVYQINMETCIAYVLNPDDRLNQYQNRLPCTNFGKYIQIFDYPDRPLIIEGSEIFRTNEIDYGTPAACNGVFNYNRGFVYNATNEWLGSDPVGGESADAPLSYVQSSNPQSEYFGAFNLGFKNRNTKANYIGSMPTNDSGIGALIISNGDSIFSYAVNQPRENWASSVFGGELVAGVGIAGNRAAVNYKRDLIFLSPEGFVSTVKIAGSDERNSFRTKTLSGRSQNWLDSVNEELYKYAVLETFNQRLYVTAKPYRTLATDTFNNTVEDFAHAGFMVMEFQTKRGDEDERPVDAGFWSGIYPMSMREVGNKFYVISKDPYGVNRFYRQDPKAHYDQLKGKNKQVGFRLYTRGFGFKSLDTVKDLWRHGYEMCFSGDLCMSYALLRNECDEPLPLVCNTDISVPVCEENCNTCQTEGKGRYVSDYSPGVEFSKDNNCNRFFRSMQLIITGAARTFSLFRIRVDANKTPEDNLKSDDVESGIINRNCDFTHDLNVYSLSERDEVIR